MSAPLRAPTFGIIPEYGKAANRGPKEFGSDQPKTSISFRYFFHVEAPDIASREFAVYSISK
jgi:hypothetical protein